MNVQAKQVLESEYDIVFNQLVSGTAAYTHLPVVSYGALFQNGETEESPDDQTGYERQISTIDASYEYYETILRATPEKRNLFYPERTVYFYAVRSMCDPPVVPNFLRLFGEVAVLKMVQCRFRCVVRVIAEYKEKSNALALVLYLRHKRLFKLPPDSLYADFVWTADNNKTDKFNEVFHMVLGEAVSSNTIVSALVPKSAVYEEIVNALCVGEVENIDIFRINKTTYSLVHVEFVDPLDAAIASACSLDRNIVVTSFYGKLTAREMRKCRSNYFSVDLIRKHIEVTFLLDELRWYRREVNANTAFFIQDAEVIKPMDTVIANGGTFPRPLCIPGIKKPVMVLHLRVPHDYAATIKPKTYNVRAIILHYFTYHASKQYASVRCFRDPPKEFNWVSCFTMEVTLLENGKIGIVLRDTSYALANAAAGLSQAGDTNFTYYSPFQHPFHGCPSMMFLKEQSYGVRNGIAVERTKNGAIFIYLPLNVGLGFTFTVPFIFQSAENVSLPHSAMLH